MKYTPGMYMAVCLKSKRLYHSSANAVTVRQTLLRLWRVPESAKDTKCGVLWMSVLSELAVRRPRMIAST